MVDFSITIDPLADVLDLMIVIILLWYVKFDKKLARRKPRKPKQTVVTAPTFVKLEQPSGKDEPIDMVEKDEEPLPVA
jgi:hypothetical protein